MRYRDDKSGYKLLFLGIAILIIYFAFFNYDIPAGYRYLVTNVQSFFQQSW